MYCGRAGRGCHRDMYCTVQSKVPVDPYDWNRWILYVNLLIDTGIQRIEQDIDCYSSAAQATIIYSMAEYCTQWPHWIYRAQAFSLVANSNLVAHSTILLRALKFWRAFAALPPPTPGGP